MSTVATTILSVSQYFAIYCYTTILIIGLLGNISNILVFTYVKAFRRNQSAFYLITMSISDLCLLLVALPFRITEVAFAYDTTRASVVWCKFKPVISYTITLTSSSAVCFAAIDQYLSTNHNPWLKRLSTLRLAQRLVSSAIVISIFYNCIFLIFFDLKPITGCAIYNTDFLRYYSFFHYIILNGIIPILVSSMFSLLAYLNVRRIVQLRMAVVRRKFEKQLTAMVLAKVVFLAVTVLPSIIFRIYILNVTVSASDSVRIAIHQLISAVSYALFYVNSAVCSLSESS